MTRRAPGDEAAAAPRRRPTLADIAGETGVSSALVSMILRGTPGPSAATAARVIAVAERLGYRTDRTASHLARRRTRSLGVTMTPSNPYHGELVDELHVHAEQMGYELILGPVTRAQDERRAIETLLDFRCEGLILLNCRLTEHDLGETIHDTPTVCVGRSMKLANVDVVRTADVAAMGALVDHLVAQGHRHIAHVDGGDLYLPRERRRGYRAAMTRHGLTPLVVPGGETEVDGAAAAAAVLEHPGITAIVAYNDLCAIGVMDHLHWKGIRVPEDVAVTGFDDDRVARLGRISLTTISPATVQQAQLAMATVLERLDGGRTTRIEKVVTPRLMARGSSGVPAVPELTDR